MGFGDAFEVAWKAVSAVASAVFVAALLVALTHTGEDAAAVRYAGVPGAKCGRLESRVAQLACVQRAAGEPVDLPEVTDPEERARLAGFLLEEFLWRAERGELDTGGTAVAWQFARATHRPGAEGLACDLGIGSTWCAVERGFRNIVGGASDPIPNPIDAARAGRSAFIATVDER